MLTSTLQKLCCCYNSSNGEESDSESCDSRPLLDRDSPMPQRRTYGSKKSTTSSAASAIFGAATSHTARSVAGSVSRSVLSDITNRVASLALENDGGIIIDTSSSGSTQGAADLGEIHFSPEFRHPYPQPSLSSLPISPKLPSLSESTHIDPVPTPATPSNDSQSNIENTGFGVLQDAYFRDRGDSLIIKSWNEIMNIETKAEKIAEASFAEVYRITNQAGSSILKIIQLKVPGDASSENSYTATKVEDVVSEIRIMNALAEVPGFVKFKDAHLVKGRPPKMVKKAYRDFSETMTRASYFPHPDTYIETSAFLALELADAGYVLENLATQNFLDRISWIWDILLGIVIALSRAESAHEFEHRDLHESNVCIEMTHAVDSDEDAAETTIKFGRSGLDVTILDYGLSRATLANGDRVYFDLESDLAIFAGPAGHPQFDAYRRMRTHLFTGGTAHFRKQWHNEASKTKNNGHTWVEFIPYTNVIWIRYILQYLIKHSKCSDAEMRNFRSEVREFQYDLSLDTAEKMLGYAVSKGWVTEEQVESYGS